MAEIKLKIGENETVFESEQALGETLSEAGFEIKPLGEFDKRYGEIRSEYESVVGEITGIKKPHGVKGTEYVRDQISEIKKVNEALEAKHNDLLGEIGNLKNTIKSGTGQQDLKNEIDALTSKVQELVGEKQELAKQKELELKQIRNEYLLQNNLSSLNLKSDVDKNAINYIEGIVKKEVLENGLDKDENGKVFLLNQNGTRKFDDQTNKVVELGEYLSAKFSDYIQKDKTGQGTGGNGTTSQKSGKTALPDEIKRRRDVVEYAKKNKISFDTKEFMDLQVQAASLPL